MVEMRSSTVNRAKSNWSHSQFFDEDEYGNGGVRKLFQWWYGLTAIPETLVDMRTIKRDTIRKSRFLSVIVFFLLLIFIMFIPACLVLPNHFVILADGGMIAMCVVALYLNRRRKPLLAGILLVISFEAALMMVILTTMPLDEPSIQQYELFVFGELLAVSLINARSVFLLAFFNSLFITLTLLFQPQTPILAHDIQQQFWPILVRPLGVQILVAGVTYLWVSSAINYMTRAYRAELIALSAHQVAERQRILAEQEKQRLKDSIEHIVFNHASAMNQHVITKIPLTTYEPVLWPLINVFNSLQNRLQHARRTEYELQQIHQAISACVESIYQGHFFPQNSLPTRTALDILLTALRDQKRIQPRMGNLPPGQP